MADREDGDESFEMRLAQLLWDVVDDADPFLDRSLIAYLCLMPLSEAEAREMLASMLQVFERLGRERPDVVLPFIGKLLNEAGGEVAG